MLAAVIALASAMAALTGAAVIFALKALGAKDSLIQALRDASEAWELAAEERRRAEEAERRRLASDSQLQLIAREAAHEKDTHEKQLEILRVELEATDHELRNHPHNRADRVQRLLQLAASRGKPSTTPTGGAGGDDPKRLPPASGTVPGSSR